MQSVLEAHLEDLSADELNSKPYKHAGPSEMAEEFSGNVAAVPLSPAEPSSLHNRYKHDYQ